MTIQEQINQQCVIITNAENFLHDTDYMSIREYEGGTPMPEEIKTRRAQCRVDINEAQAIIEELERQKEQEEPTSEPPEPTGEEVSHNE